MTDLFERGPLEQSTGILDERWGQDGSDLVNDTVLAALGDTTLYTVSAGKRLFIKDIYVSCRNATAVIYLYDGTPGPYNKKIAFYLLANENQSLTLSTPLFFDTSVVISVVGAGAASDVSVTGWEEDGE